jgi:hypothetical protein
MKSGLAYARQAAHLRCGSFDFAQDDGIGGAWITSAGSLSGGFSSENTKARRLGRAFLTLLSILAIYAKLSANLAEVFALWNVRVRRFLFHRGLTRFGNVQSSHVSPRHGSTHFLDLSAPSCRASSFREMIFDKVICQY